MRAQHGGEGEGGDAHVHVFDTLLLGSALLVALALPLAYLWRALAALLSHARAARERGRLLARSHMDAPLLSLTRARRTAPL